MRRIGVQGMVDIWSGLDMRRRVVLGLAVAAVLASVFAIARMASAPSLSLLYAGLENGAAGDVVQALEQAGAVYEVRGGSIFVDAAQRDQLRMTLASEGLPAHGGRGYELLDSLNGFGTTAQMFDAAYWRAKEGELARTIVASPFAAQARVHIAHVGSSPFARSAKPTASVAITPTGGEVTADQARAIRHLVAAAVTGLSVEDVTVIDSSGRLIGDAAETPLTPAGEDRATAFRDRVQRLVEARVGPGNAVVEVSVETVTETESIRERLFDPESRVAISSEVEERTNTSSETAPGVTVASDLPDGDAGAGEGSSAQGSETRERVNYEVSETEREVLRAPGAIRRITVAVLVNGLAQENADGSQTVTPRPDEEIAALRDLVASAVGFDEARGDVITIRSMDLAALPAAGTVAEQGWLQGTAIDVMSLIQTAVLALVALVLALFVVRPLLLRPPAPQIALPPATPSETPPLLTGEIDEDGVFPDTAASVRTLSTSPAQVQDTQADPVARLRAQIHERRDETVEILRTWLEDEERVS